MTESVKGKAGRPPSAPAPRPPEPYERQEFADRLQAILDAVEISDLAKDVRLFLQKMLRRCDVLRALDAKRFPAKGDEQVTLLLRTVFESSNGAAALTLPILRAVSHCALPVWVEKGLRFIEAFDLVDLVALQATLVGLGLDDQFDRVLRQKLEGILGSPKSPVVPEKAKVRPKMARPPGVSEETWNEVIAIRKSVKRKPKPIDRRALRMAA